MPSRHLAGPRARLAGARGHRRAHVDVKVVLGRLNLVAIFLGERRQVKREACGREQPPRRGQPGRQRDRGAASRRRSAQTPAAEGPAFGTEAATPLPLSNTKVHAKPTTAGHITRTLHAGWVPRGLRGVSQARFLARHSREKPFPRDSFPCDPQVSRSAKPPLTTKLRRFLVTSNTRISGCWSHTLISF